MKDKDEKNVQEEHERNDRNAYKGNERADWLEIARNFFILDNKNLDATNMPIRYDDDNINKERKDDNNNKNKENIDTAKKNKNILERNKIALWREDVYDVNNIIIHMIERPVRNESNKENHNDDNLYNSNQDNHRVVITNNMYSILSFDMNKWQR